MSTVSSRGSIVVRTTRGAVRGSVEGDIARFLGIPFAAPPFGENRFELPQPHQPWPGELEATRYGPTPPQTPYEGVYARLLPSPVVEGEEILNLNIWSPAGAVAAEGRLPVMVWVYGGAFLHGANCWPMYDGTPFARDGVVFVALNYRVGVEGFALLEDAPNNRGFADVVAALDWVREEIDAFGGDPDDITVFGQSAGGGLIATLLASPAAAGRFRKAIVMSAAMGPSWPPAERTIATAIAEELGIRQTKQDFAARSPAELAQVQRRVMGGGTIGSGRLFHQIVPGDDLLPEPAWAALSAGAGDAVPVLIGTTAAEGRFWYGPQVASLELSREALEAMLSVWGVDRDAFELYRRNRPGDTDTAVFGDLVLDKICRAGLNEFADRRHAAGSNTWVYEFAWPSPVLGLGAAHCVDVPFLFDNLENEWSRALVGDAAPRQLAAEMHRAFIEFAKSGNPGWRPWDRSRPVMSFNSPASEVVEAPREDERLALAGGPP